MVDSLPPLAGHNLQELGYHQQRIRELVCPEVTPVWFQRTLIGNPRYTVTLTPIREKLFAFLTHRNHTADEIASILGTDWD